MFQQLSPRQRRFVEEYLTDLNATQAAIRAGYSARTANEQGPRLLVNVGIATAIQTAQEARSQRVLITQDDVLRGLHREATFTGDGSSHSARVSAWGLIGKHLGMFVERRQLGEDGEVFTIAITNGSGREMPQQAYEADQTALTISHRPDCRS
jgi:hypothetical protein